MPKQAPTIVDRAWADVSPRVVEFFGYVFAVAIQDTGGDRCKVQQLRAGPRLSAYGLRERIKDRFTYQVGKVAREVEHQSIIEDAAAVLSTVADHGVIVVRVAPHGREIFYHTWGQLPAVEAAIAKL